MDDSPPEHKREGRIRRRLVQGDPTYAAMVEALDRNVGRVLRALSRNGLAERTVVVFTSDNGGLATGGGAPTTNRPLAEGKGWTHEGGHRVPLIVRWPGLTARQRATRILETPLTTPDVFPTVLDAAGLDTPGGQECDGRTLRPALAGDPL